MRCGPRAYQWLLLVFILAVVAFLAICVALTMTISPPTARDSLITPAPTPSRTTHTTITEPASTTTTAAHNATTTSAPHTTTPVPIPPVNVTCPANATIQLGSSLLPTYTGGSAIGQGGCTQPQPIVTYVDTTTPPLNSTLLSQLSATSGITGTLATARLSMAVGATQVVVVVASNSGSALVYVYNKALTTLLAPAFALSSLAINACNGTSGAGSEAWPQVLWDGPAQRWLLMESTNDTLHLCLYVSMGANALGAYQAEPYTLDAGDGYETTYAQLALWGTTYSFTLAQCRLCVIDRAVILAGDPDVGYFCAQSLNALLPAFIINAWTPLHAEGNVAISSQVENAGGAGAGAVFMRAIDQDLQYHVSAGADLIDVEHWYAINFTAASYYAVRYRIAVANFDQSYALCPSIDICIPTPSAFELDPIREPLLPRLTYRPGAGVLATLTSHANGVDIARYYWFHFQWVSPFWSLYDQGISPVADGLHKWLASAAFDAYGNIAIGYCASNTTTWPSLFANMRLASDYPAGKLRNTTLALGVGPSPSHLLSTQWGQGNAMAGDPVLGRSWFFAGQYGAAAPNAWAVQTSSLSMAGQSVARNWTAQVRMGKCTCIYCNFNASPPFKGLLRRCCLVLARDSGRVILKNWLISVF